VSSSRPIAIVAGALAAKSGNGGHAWSRVSIALGLRRLGFAVVFIEELAGATTSERDYFERVCAQFQIDGSLVDRKLSYELVARADAADLLLNIGGHLTCSELKRGPRVKVYLDDDPGYTQLWLQARLLDGRLDGHDFFFTFGENIGLPGCALPVDGITWRPLRPPVVLDHWRPGGQLSEGFRTVASWRGGYGRVEADGHRYGQKAHEFRRFVDMPKLTGHRYEIALKIDRGDASDEELLRSRGWQLTDPTVVAAVPDDFRAYVQGSRAEFSVAQGIYVETRCAWFSDRTTRFLASGKPAVVQDTGFSSHLPTGEGLLAFTTVDEAVDATNAVERDYKAHSAAARAIAEKHFDSDKVLGRMLEEVGL